ncbi:UNKNOWN [Stylonychia lemnae]|uniref:Uncharacterized protein n=1 Tax=Stylonychia lemnae TaxID=5949 RepID=A0A077ZND2_STYLE|nr:UNKNOWN [Stylonychia lemnae]|eukprot:CDW71487.1 UNKNOWN [Stylonychia lemnae]
MKKGNEIKLRSPYNNFYSNGIESQYASNKDGINALASHVGSAQQKNFTFNDTGSSRGGFDPTHRSTILDIVGPQSRITPTNANQLDQKLTELNNTPSITPKQSPFLKVLDPEETKYNDRDQAVNVQNTIKYYVLKSSVAKQVQRENKTVIKFRQYQKLDPISSSAASTVVSFSKPKAHFK